MLSAWFLVCVLSLAGAAYDMCSDDETGTSLACQASSSDVIWFQTYRLTVAPSNATCGSPASTFRRLGSLNGPAQICDAGFKNFSHPPDNMVDTDATSWWQSASMANNSNELKINITLSFDKMFLMAGDIIMTFNSGRPEKMILEKSRDNGATWSLLQIYARDCMSFQSELVPGNNVSTDNPTAVTCTNRYVETGPRPTAGQKVKFAVDDRFRLFLGPQEINFNSLYTALDMKLLEFLMFTDLRIRLIQPAMDGRQNYDMYYYAISDIQAAVWCYCNLHAAYCNYTEVGVVCDCKHNTAGKNCESCLPLYNNRPYQRGSFLPWDSGTAHECIKCECHDHADSCEYNVTYGQGVCHSCKHNTHGYHCHLCAPTFYPNMSLSLSDVNRCVACDCDMFGVQDNMMDCSQTESPGAVIGQCSCRAQVSGRRCDECLPGFYSLKTGRSPGTCTACNCITDGTVGESNTCQQNGGQCPCKNKTQGRDCGSCSDGYFSFPTGQPDRDCLSCDCDEGGSLDAICDKESGQCLCRENIIGRKCDKVNEGFYVPMIDSLTFEPKSGDCLITSDLYKPERLFDGPGFALCDLHSGNVTLTTQSITGARSQKDLEWPHLVAVRYSSNSINNVAGTVTVQVTGDTEYDLSLLTVKYGPNLSYKCPLSLGASSHVSVTFSTGISRAIISESDYVTLDIRCQYSVMLELYQVLDVNVAGINVTSTAAPSTRQRRDTAPSTRERRDTAPSTRERRDTAPSTRERRDTAPDKAPTITIDSLLFLPALTNDDGSRQSQIYSQSENKTEMWMSYLSCLQQVAVLSSRQTALEQSPCKELLFSVGAELYNGTMGCDCDTEGAVSAVTCQDLGGQCQCKSGVIGRNCSVCLPGYFNFSSDGCTACQCHPSGASSGACNMTTGQCPCRPNVSRLDNLVMDPAGLIISNNNNSNNNNSNSNNTNNSGDGTCSSCMLGYYGINDGSGCHVCACNEQGTLTQQCDEMGQCPCKNSVMGLKCDMCRDGFFGFSSAGCSPCNCSDAGSTILTCNLTTGACTCKSNTQGDKCSTCKPGSFNLHSHNPQGCQPCFCYAHGDSCTSASHFRIKLLQISNPASSVLPEELLGDVHNLYGLKVTLWLSARYSLDLYNTALISVVGSADKIMSHPARNGTLLSPGQVMEYIVQFWEGSWFLQDDLQSLSALGIMEILANVTDMSFIDESPNVGVNVSLVQFEVVERVAESSGGGGALSIGVHVTNVEQCVCDVTSNVTGPSCERCSIGHMRQNTTTASKYDSCVPCDCSGRGTTDPPECHELTGKCLNCRNGTVGDRCESCAPNVEEQECDNCTDGFWGLQADGCRACNCSKPGAMDSVCDKTSGQCVCGSHVVGRTCSQCEENYHSLTAAGCVECDECYKLMVTKIKPLRESVVSISSNLSLLVSQDMMSTLGTFTTRLSFAVLQAQQMRDFFLSVETSASNINQYLENFNVTLLGVKNDLSKVENMTSTTEQDLSKADTIIKQARSYRVNMEADVKIVLADIASQQVSGDKLARLSADLKFVETFLQALAENSVAHDAVLAQLTRISQTVSAAKILIDQLSQKSTEVWRQDEDNTRTLLVLESKIVNLVVQTSRMLSSVRSLESSDGKIRISLTRQKSALVDLQDYVVDFASLAGRTASSLSWAMSAQSQAVAETNFFSPMNMKALQSKPVIQELANETQQLGSVASLLLWRSDGLQHQASIIQTEALLLLESGNSILAIALNFSSQAAAVQQQANSSLHQLTSLSQSSQDLLDQAQNLTDSVVLLKHNTSAARLAAQQGQTIIQDKLQRLQNLSAQAQKVEQRLMSVQDASKVWYTTLNETKTNIVTPAQEFCVDASTAISEFQDKFSQTESVTSQAGQQLSHVTQAANQMLTLLNTRNLDTENVRLLVGQVLQAQTNLNGESLKLVISQLQTSRSIQQAEIDRLRGLRSVLKERAEGFKLLKQQIAHMKK